MARFLKYGLLPCLLGILYVPAESFVLEHLLSFARTPDFTFLCVAVASSALVALVLQFPMHDFTFSAVLAVTTSIVRVGEYAVTLLTHKNAILLNTAYLILIANWAGILFAAILLRLLDFRKKRTHFERFFRAVTILFITLYLPTLVYALFLRLIILGMPIHYRAVNLIPLRTILQFLHGEGPNPFEQLIGNLLLFLPLGFLLQAFGRKISRLARAAIIVGVPLLCEILQFVFALGSSDIDDVLLNAAGAYIGAGICILLEKLDGRIHPGDRLFSEKPPQATEKPSETTANVVEEVNK